MGLIFFRVSSQRLSRIVGWGGYVKAFGIHKNFNSSNSFFAWLGSLAGIQEKVIKYFLLE